MITPLRPKSSNEEPPPAATRPPTSYASIDHVMPRSRGGMNVWENVTAACRPCNLRKRDRTPEEAGMRLASEPHAPRELAWISVSVGRVPDAWKQYLAHAS